MGFQDSCWNIYTSNLTILDASVFIISCGKKTKKRNKPTDRHINAAECPSHATTVGLGKYDVVIASSMIFTKFVTTEYCGRHIPECVVSSSIWHVIGPTIRKQSSADPSACGPVCTVHCFALACSCWSSTKNRMIGGLVDCLHPGVVSCFVSAHAGCTPDVLFKAVPPPKPPYFKPWLKAIADHKSQQPISRAFVRDDNIV